MNQSLHLGGVFSQRHADYDLDARMTNAELNVNVRVNSLNYIFDAQAAVHVCICLRLQLV